MNCLNTKQLVFANDLLLQQRFWQKNNNTIENDNVLAETVSDNQSSITYVKKIKQSKQSQQKSRKLSSSTQDSSSNTSQPLKNNNQPQVLPKYCQQPSTQSIYCQQFPSPQSPPKTAPIKSNLQTLYKLLQTVTSIHKKIQFNLIEHLSTMRNADKYLRLFGSVIKIIKAIDVKTKYQSVGKEISMLRRIVQWQTKFQIVRDVKCQQFTIRQIIVETIQMWGNLADFIAFWLSMFQDKVPQLKPLIQTLSQHENDCYFYQCCFSFSLHLYNFFKVTKQYLSLKNISNTQQKINRHAIKVDLIKNGVKTLKFILDIITSHNNYSRRIFQIKPLIGGILTMVSSLLSMGLIWGF